MHYYFLTYLRAAISQLASDQLTKAIIAWYQTSIKFFVYLFKKDSHSIYLRRGASSKITPLISDIDLTLIVDHEDKIQPFLKSYKFFLFKIIFPMSKEVEVLTRKNFSLWCKYGAFRSYESRDWKHLCGVDIRESHNVESVDEFQFNVLSEVAHLYWRYYKNINENSSNLYKQIIIKKYTKELKKLIQLYNEGKYRSISRDVIPSFPTDSFFEIAQTFFCEFINSRGLRSWIVKYQNDEEYQYPFILGLKVVDSQNEKGMYLSEEAKLCFKISGLQESKFLIEFLHEKSLSSLKHNFLINCLIRKSHEEVQNERSFELIFFNLIRILRYVHLKNGYIGDFHEYNLSNADFYKDLIDEYESLSTISIDIKNRFEAIEKNLLEKLIQNLE